MKSVNQNFKQSLSVKQLPQKLRELADILEKEKSFISDNAVNLNEKDSFKLCIKYKNYDDIIKTKIIIEPVSDELSIDTYSEQTLFMDNRKKKKKTSLKKLKSSLYKNFEIIKDSLNYNKLPDLHTVENFYKDCELMTLFNQKGKEYYEEFLDAARDFYHETVKNNLSKAGYYFNKIDYIKEECHKTYK